MAFKGGNNAGMQNLMRQAQKMQEEMEKTAQLLDDWEVVGTAASEAVVVYMNAKKIINGIELDESVVDPDDIEMLEDLIMAAINDDFFSGNRPEIYTPEVLRQQRYELHNWFEKPIEFWSVIYEREHIKGTDVLPWTMEYDLTTLWVWYSENVAELQDHLEWGKKLTKDGRVILGVYMYDYGNGCPISDDRMKRQLDFTYEKLVKGEIEGAMLHSSCNMDIGLNSTLITKEWLEALK